MEGSKKKRISYRLLAIALTVAMVFTMLPGNLFSAWAEETLRVNVSRSGDGTVGYRLNEEAEVGLFGDGHDQDFFDVDLEQFSRLELHLQAAGDSVVSGVKVGALEKSIENGQKDVSVALSEADFAADNLTNGQLNVVVSFEAPQAEEPEYTVSAGTLEQVSVSLKGKDESEFQLLDSAEGRTLTEEQLPAAVRISPNAGYELRAVSVNGAAVTDLDENNVFSLTKEMFQGGKAVIAASAELPAQEPQEYGFSSVELVNCTAVLTVGDETLTLSTDTKLSAEQLETGAVLTFTAKEEADKSYVLSSVLVGGTEKAGTADQGKSEFSYTLTAADFNSEGKTAVKAEFVENTPAPQYDYTLHLIVSGEGSVTIKRKNDADTVAVTDGMGLNDRDLPGILYFQGAELDGTQYVIEYLKVGSSEITNGVEQPASSYTLRKNNFNADGELTIEVRFKAKVEVQPTLNVGNLGDYQVFVMNEDGSWPEEAVSEGTELSFPVTVRIKTTDENRVLTSVKVKNLENEQNEVEILPADQIAKSSVDIQLDSAPITATSMELSVVTAALRKVAVVQSGEGTVSIYMPVDSASPWTSTEVEVLDGGSIRVVAEWKNNDSNSDHYVVSSIQINDSAENEYSITENGSYEKFSVEFENDYDKLNEEKVAFQIQNIQDDLNVVVGFVKTYNLSLASGSDAVVKAELKHENQSEPYATQEITSEAVMVLSGDSAKITVEAPEGKLVTDVKVNGATPAGLSFVGVNAVFELTGIAEDMSIQVETKDAVIVSAAQNDNYIVTVSDDNDRSASTQDGDFTLPVASGTELTVTVEPAEGYVVTSICGQEIAQNESPVMIQKTVTENTVISVSVEANYTVKLDGVENGTVKALLQGGAALGPDGDGKITIPESQINGAKLRFTANEGYAVRSYKLGDQNAVNGGTDQVSVDAPISKELFAERLLSVHVDFAQVVKVKLITAENCGIYRNETTPFAANSFVSVFKDEEIELTAKPTNNNYVWAGIKIGEAMMDDYSVTMLENGSVKFTIKAEYAPETTFSVYFEQKASISNISFQQNGSDTVPIRSYSDSNRLVYVFADRGPVSIIHHGRIKNHQVYFYLTNKSTSDPGTALTELSVTHRLTDLTYYVYVLGWQTISLPSDKMYIVLDNVKPVAKVGEKDFAEYLQEHVFAGNANLSLTVRDPVCTYHNGVETLPVPNGFSGIRRIIISAGGTNIKEIDNSAANAKPETMDVSFSLPAPENPEVESVAVTIKAIDWAGNEMKSTYDVQFNPVTPEVSLEMDSSAAPVTVEGRDYYSTFRRAKIVVHDKANSFTGFDKEGNSTLEGIQLSGTVRRLDGSDIQPNDYLEIDGDWTQLLDEEGYAVADDDNRSIYEVNVWLKDGNYTLTGISYTNKAEKTADGVVNESFTVDTVAPTGKLVLDENSFWEELATTLTFGIWKPSSVSLHAEALKDATSGVGLTHYYIQYFAGNEHGQLKTLEDLQALPFTGDEGQAYWQPYEGSIVVDNNKRFVVYLRVADKVGNASYISTNGIITDDKGVELTLTAQETTFRSEDGETPLYGIAGGSAVEVSVDAADDQTVGSGIRTIKYWISLQKEDEEPANAEILFDQAPTVNEEHPTYGELVKEFHDVISVNKADYNACKVYVHVKAVDNAGNESYACAAIDIDNTAPSIQVSPAPEMGIGARKIEITERGNHFVPEQAVVTVTPTNYTVENPQDVYEISEWVRTQGENPETDAVYTAYVTFQADAQITIDVSCTDRAGNTAAAQDTLIVDKTNPTGSITVLDQSWSKLLETLSFGLWGGENADRIVSASYADATSGIASVKYYVAEFTDETGSSDKLLTREELMNEYQNHPGSWRDYTDPFTVSADKRFVVYLRMEDKVGNVEYICTNGIIFDNRKVELTLKAEDTEFQAADGTPLYGIEPEEYVTVAVTAKDLEVRSGIQSIRYWIALEETPEEPEGEAVSLFEAEVNTAEGHPSYGELVREFSPQINSDDALIRVNKADYNACKVYVYVKAVDNAGNETTEKKVLDIDNDAPVIVITDAEVDGKPAKKIEITERKHHFDPDKALIEVTATDLEQGNVHSAYHIVPWSTPDDAEDGETCVHTAYVVLDKEANFEIKVECTDLAGNKTVVDPVNLSYDNTPPTGTIRWKENSWSDLLQTLSFGLWSKEDMEVSAEVSDEISGVAKVQYYVYQFETEEDQTIFTEKSLDEHYEENPELWVDYSEPFSVPVDARFVVYLRMEDNNTNHAYISTNGLIAEDDAIDIQLEASVPETPHYDTSGTLLYGQADPVSVSVKAIDPSTRSGIRSVRYWITLKDGDDEPDNAEILFDQEPAEDPSYDDLVKEFSEETHPGQATIFVDKAAYNACKVYVYVKAVDNAGNEATACQVLDIDNTEPQISIDYERESLDGAKDGYYNSVTAIVSYTERSDHFDQAAAEAGLKVEGENSNGPITLTLNDSYEILGWEDHKDVNDPDSDTHIMRIRFKQDARYHITLNYADRAGNAAEPKEDWFTLDTEEPTGTVTVVGKGSWTKLVEVLTFGLWSKDESVKVTATAIDDTSPLYPVQYCKLDRTTAMQREDLKNLEDSQWSDFQYENTEDGLEISEEQRFAVYLRIVDYAGHVTYLGTDGVVVDRTLERKQITLQPSMASGMDASGENPIYGILDNVYVDLKVTDAEPWSGIKEVKYQITGAGQTESRVVYTYDYQRDEGLNSNGGHLVITENGKVTLDQSGVIPGYEDLTHAWSTRIPVDKATFNSCDTVVRVDVTDNAGNTSYNEVSLDIDNTRPVIEVSYDTTRNDLAAEKYYTSLTATVTITERDHHFDPAAATAGIVIEGTDGKGAKLPAAGLYTISGWTKVDGETPDSCKHVATITFHKDANYTLNVNYTDRATNSAVEPYADAFTVDATKPTGTLRAASLTDTIWTDIINQLTFNLFSKLTVEISHTAADETSPLASVAYFRTDRNSVYGEGELLALPESSWTAMPGGSLDHGNFLVPANARATVYLRVIDKAGNIRFISTDGFIVDNTQPVVENVAPRVTVTPAQPVNGIYNTDVPIRVRVVDPVVNGSYSGIKQIRYEVRNMGSTTQSGELYNYSGVASSQTQLTQAWENASAIVVDCARNNSNDVEIIVYAVDNAGNENHDSVKIQIDVTAPTISVSYDNNDGDTSFADGTTDAFFRNPRTATIVITERNFDPNAVTITLTNTDGPVPQLSGWRTEGGGGNNDTTRHIATLSYSADGDYSFDISCADLAGNRSEGVDYNGLAPQKFTIDLQDPEIRVSYDPAQNEAAQEKDVYFNSVRVATITVTEHNFDASRVKIDLKATDHGAPVTAPVLSAWTHNGNVHTATIRYESDARYSFDVSCADKAGREAADYQEDLFYVDQTPPAVTLEGIVDRSGNSGAGNIGFRLYATDTNFDRFEPVLTGSFFRDGKYVTETIDLSGSISDIEDGKQLVIENLPEDGIYTLTCTVVDKAGNSFREITRYDANGQPYTAEADAATALATFSVNRDGSAFAVDDSTLELLSYYYVQRVQQDVTLIETNANELVEHTLTLNGKELTEGTDYTVELEPRDKDSDWYRYVYKVDRDLFEAEGLYVVALSSKDSAGNTTYSDYKQVSDVSEKAQFVVDRTAPVVAISGMETDGRYQTDRQLVTLMPTDDGGALKSIRVILVDEEGNEKRTLVDLKGEEFKEALEANDGVITFTLEEGLYQNVRIICDDWADPSGEENVIYDETFTNISVSTSSFMIFWANRSLRWGVIGGAGGLGGLGILLLLLKKRKKKDEEEVKPAK